MLAPQLGSGIQLLLSQPDHIGTQVPLLIVFLVLDRAPRRWYTPVAIGVLLTWVIIADTVAILHVRLVVAGALRALWAIARNRERVAAQWFEFSLVAAGAVGTGAGLLIVRVIGRLDGFAMMPTETGIITTAKVPAHLWLTVQGIDLLGAHVVGRRERRPPSRGCT